MEKITRRDFQIKRAATKIHTPEQALAAEIWEWSAKKLSFPMVMVFIKRHGRQFVYERWNEIKQSLKVDDPIKLFMWKMRG